MCTSSDTHYNKREHHRAKLHATMMKTFFVFCFLPAIPSSFISSPRTTPKIVFIDTNDTIFFHIFRIRFVIVPDKSLLQSLLLLIVRRVPSRCKLSPVGEQCLWWNPSYPNHLYSIFLPGLNSLFSDGKKTANNVELLPTIFKAMMDETWGEEAQLEYVRSWILCRPLVKRYRDFRIYLILQSFIYLK